MLWNQLSFLRQAEEKESHASHRLELPQHLQAFQRLERCCGEQPSVARSLVVQGMQRCFPASPETEAPKPPRLAPLR